jgi:hypothetical protein
MPKMPSVCKNHRQTVPIARRNALVVAARSAGLN